MQFFTPTVNILSRKRAVIVVRAPYKVNERKIRIGNSKSVIISTP